MPNEVPDDTHDVQGSMQASPVRKYSDLSVHFETMPSLSLDGVLSSGLFSLS